MDLKRMREILECYNLEHSIVKNKKSKKYSMILENNVMDTENKEKRVVIFSPLPEGKDKFSMERDRFYSEFEDAFDDDEAIKELMTYFENNK